MTMNLRLAEYVIAFYAPCDRHSHVINHDQSEASLIYVALRVKICRFSKILICHKIVLKHIE